MYTSYIGKKFLKLYREKEKKPDDYSARQFFDEVLFPLFFDDEKHFLNVANSSFFQSISEKVLNQGKSIHHLKRERFHENVKEGASMTTLVGYAAQGIVAGTSGQVTSMKLEITEEDMYCSWIGSGFSVAMGGGYSMLLDDNATLLGLYDGWKFYRKVLDQTNNLKGNQIDVWNSYWIIHLLSKKYDGYNPFDNFTLPETDICKNDKWKKLGYIEFSTNKWSKIIFALAKKYPNQIICVNAFKFADTNQTLGFINIFLPEVKQIYQIRDKYFFDRAESELKDNEIEQFEAQFLFHTACKNGTIGLKSLEPAKLWEYMPNRTNNPKEYKFTDENSKINFSLYKLWIIAMLNKSELLQLAADVAKSLIELEVTNSQRGKNTQNQSSKELLEAKSLKTFIEGLTENINESNGKTFKNVVDQLVKMPSDNFPLFVTLIRFEYAYQKSNNSQQTN
jgi:hypothetical protein